MSCICWLKTTLKKGLERESFTFPSKRKLLFLFFLRFWFNDLFLEVGLDLPTFRAFDDVHEAVVLRFVERIVDLFVGQHIVAFALYRFHTGTDRFPDAIHEYVFLGGESP